MTEYDIFETMEMNHYHGRLSRALAQSQNVLLSPMIEAFVAGKEYTVAADGNEFVLRSVYLTDINDFNVNDVEYHTPYGEVIFTESTIILQEVGRGTLIAVPPYLPKEGYPNFYFLFGYEGELGNMKNIRLVPSGANWVKADLNAVGTKVGGWPTFSDEFTGLIWPHYMNVPIKFAGQYLLEDGRYTRMFINEEIDDDYYADGSFFACAIVDGGPIPEGVEMAPLDERYITYGNLLLRTPEFALAPNPENPSFPLAPEWFQSPEGPDAFGRDFVLQFGATPFENDGQHVRLKSYTMDYDGGGEIYLFVNPNDGTAEVLTQPA